jgi:hypothetical protein
MKNKEVQRMLDRLKKKAVKDMQDWLLTLDNDPTKGEILAYKAGYMAGYNRGSNNS